MCRYINQDGYSQSPSIAGIGVAVIFRSGAPEWDYDVSHHTQESYGTLVIEGGICI